MKLQETILRHIDLHFEWVYPLLFTYTFIIINDVSYFIEFITLLLAIYSIKYTVKKERPNQKDSLSFPSGHTALVWFIVWKLPNSITITYAILVSYSRVYYLHHWWSDVIAGLILSYWINFLFQR
jgi:membrane-associated phospholipid phosphatase